MPRWRVTLEAREGELEPLLTALAHLDARLQPGRPRIEVHVRAADGDSAVDYVRVCAARARVTPTVIQVQPTDDE